MPGRNYYMTKKKKLKKGEGRKLTAQQLQREILKMLARQPKKRFNPKQIGQKLNSANNRDSIQHALDKLAETNQIFALGNYKYQVRKAPGKGLPSREYTGKVDMTLSGAAYIIVEELEDDIRVNPRNLNTALDGDKVRIRAWTHRGRSRMEGEVTEILERAAKRYLGTYWKYENYGLVTPQGKMPYDIQIPIGKELGANDGEKVVVAITGWTKGKYPQPLGEITGVLGAPGSNDIEMKAILINNGFDLDFPDEVMQESQQLSDTILPDELEKRRDMRTITTFTIDPLTAKDFDDALSVEWKENEQVEIGVHIADVTHFVQPKTALDKEAFKRSTSVYLVDRVLPMLPERLSNELCSLRPGEDKFTFSCVFTFDKNLNIKSRWIGKTFTHSNRRFTYEEAQEIIEAKEGAFSKELLLLNKIAHRLRNRRFKKGAINFESDEVQFRLDDDSKPVEIYVKQRKDAHLLVEDFMLLANRSVAEYIDKMQAEQAEIPFVYRVHDEPNGEKVDELARFASELGFEIDTNSPRSIANSYNRLLKAGEENPGLRVLAPMAIRTMAKAEYTTENIGHYGLGFEHYTHFTSPIRRYSDVLAHRILQLNLIGKEPYRTAKNPLEEQCQHISRMERKAMDAERESVKYKLVEFMEDHIGETFDGFINGIIERGFFVELADSHAEGMVAFDSMPEPVNVSASGLSFKGKRSGRIYKMGDPVKVTIVRADLAKRQIDMHLATPS